MSISVRFNNSLLSVMALAKVGNSLRDEPLQTSKTLCKFDTNEAEILTGCFLRRFRSLEPFRFDKSKRNVVAQLAAKVFDEPDSLLENGREIARQLYARSNHPNIKAGDLCIGLVDDVIAESEKTQALCIIKSENKVPFLQITIDDGDLRLTTQHGIYPDKIDKGCLIINHQREHGFVAYVFDRNSSETHFWNRDFLNVVPRKDDDYMTRRYTELCVAFAKDGLPSETREERRYQLANRAISAINDSERFDLDDFKSTVFEDEAPEVVEQFSAFKDDYETRQGSPLEATFTIAKPVAEKAKKKLKGRLKLDCGADILFSSAFIDESDTLFERGFDDERKMNFVKIYFTEEA